MLVSEARKGGVGKSIGELHIEREAPLRDRIATIQRFLGERYFHPSGIMYSGAHWRDGHVREFCHDDFVGQDVPVSSDGFSPEGHVNFENSPWTSALFLWSQVLRMRAEPSDEAGHFARKAFESLDRIFALGEAAGQRGFLCKPYDAQLSRETSGDQYTAVMLALNAYYDVAEGAVRARIADILVAMAEFWRELDYRHIYFDHPLDLIEQGRAPDMACLNHIAYRLTNDEKYRDEAYRLMAIAGAWPTWIDEARARTVACGRSPHWREELHGYEYEPSRRPYLMHDLEYRGAMWLQACPAAYFLEHAPESVPLMKHAIARRYDQMRLGMTEDLMYRYSVQIDLERDICFPLTRPVRAGGTEGVLCQWLFFAYNSGVLWGDATSRIVDMALVGHLVAPEFCAGAMRLARDMLHRLDDRRLLWFLDPDGQQLLPELRWMGHVLSSDAPAFSLIAYWRARAAGLAIDED